MRRHDAVRRDRLRPARRQNQVKPAFESVERRLLMAAFQVTNTSDDVLLAGSLRNELTLANADNSGTPTVVSFDITRTGAVSTISPLSALPTITRSMTIDATGVSGYNGSPLVELSGTSAGTGVSGLTISAGNTTVMGLGIDRFGGAGIRLTTAGNNTISQNYIGLTPTGQMTAANGLDGIIVQANSNGNTISSNVISGNIGNGININGTLGGTSSTMTTGNVVTGNTIGLNAAGTSAVANGGDGVLVLNAPTTTIGGSGGSRNVISGNANGIELYFNSSGTSVQGNYIGLNAAGSTAIGNGSTVVVGATGGGGPGSRISGDGIALRGITNSTIGGTASGAGNYISGNTGTAIINSEPTSGTEPTGITIQGNVVGPTVNGNASAFTGQAAISLGLATNVTIGGTAAGARNVIAGNSGDGISSSGTGLVVQGNYIGVGVNGTIALGNSGNGINTSGGGALIGASPTGTITTTGANIIANNSASGVNVSIGNGTSILSNTIYNNANLGIQLVGTANNSIAAPTLNSAISTNTSSTFTGTINGPVGTYKVQFFSTPTANTPQGRTLIGTATVTTTSTTFDFSSTLATSFLPGNQITATITNATNSTSQFSNSVIGSGTGQGTQFPTMTVSTSASTITSGSTVTYTFTIVNLGTVSNQGVNFSDAFPSGATFLNGTAVNQNGTASNNVPIVISPDGTTGNVAIGVIAPSATVTIKITLAINSASPTTTSVTNTGVLTATVPTIPSSTGMTDTATATVTVTPLDDVTVGVFAPSSVAVSDNIAYQITVGNNGPSTATGVSLTDVLPAGVTLVSATSDTGTASPTISGSTLTFAIGSLAQGQVANITIIVSTSPSTPTSVTDTATVTGTQPDSDSSSNMSSATTTVVPSADVEVVSDTASTANIISGQPVTFTIIVRNNGPSTATLVSLADTLPAGLIFQSGTAAGGTVTVANGVVTAPVGTLTAGATSTITITAQTAAFGTLTDSAVVTASEGDPNQGNNTGSASVVAAASSDLAVVFGATTGTGNIGDPLTFTATVTNNGPSPATGVTFSNPIVAGTTYVSSTLNGTAAGNLANGTLTIPIGALAAGASAQITFTVTPSAAGSITDTASVTENEPDPNPANNTATTTTTIVVPTSVVSFASQLTSVNETAGTASIVLNREGPTGTAVTVHFSTVAGGNATPGLDYTPISVTVTFPVGVTQQIINIPVLADPFDRVNELVKLQLDSPTGGGILLGGGTTTTSTLQIINVDPVVVGPKVTSIKTYGPLNAITAVEVGFTGNADPTTAGLAANYEFIALGGSGKGFLPSGTVIPASLASFNAATASTLVFASRPLPVNELFVVVVNGTTGNPIVDRAGNPLNSTFGSVAASNYLYTVARGNNISYTDENGTPVNLKLSGPGVIDLDRNAAGQVERIQLLGVTNKTTISGSVTPKGRHTTIGEVLGFSTFGKVKSKLLTPPFYITSRAYPNSLSVQGPPATDVLLGGSASFAPTTTTVKSTTKVKSTAVTSTTTSATVAASDLTTPVMSTVTTTTPTTTAAKHPHANVVHKVRVKTIR